MIGTNDLHLNQATVRKAIQEYLDKRCPGVTVTNLTYQSDYNGETYIVRVVASDDSAAVPSADRPA